MKSICFLTDPVCLKTNPKVTSQDTERGCMATLVGAGLRGALELCTPASSFSFFSPSSHPLPARKLLFFLPNLSPSQVLVPFFFLVKFPPPLLCLCSCPKSNQTVLSSASRYLEVQCAIHCATEPPCLQVLDGS